MRQRSATLVTGVVLGILALGAAPALASGGGGTGGGGSGGGGGTASGGTGGGGSSTGTATGGGTTCIQISNFSGSADQSMSTDAAYLSGSYTVSRCGGSGSSFNIQMTASDAGGNQVISATDTWVPSGKQPFGGTHSTDNAAFATAYTLAVKVVDPVTGAVLASQSQSVPTPAARIPACATVSNLGGTAGYYPNRTTDGALWLSYSVKNCGGNDWLDADLKVVNTDNSTVVANYPNALQLQANTSGGVGLVDVEPVPTGTNYQVRLEVRHHNSGGLLDSGSIDLLTPDAK